MKSAATVATKAHEVGKQEKFQGHVTGNTKNASSMQEDRLKGISQPKQTT